MIQKPYQQPNAYIVCPDSGFTWTNSQNADIDQCHCGWVNVLRARLYKEQDSLVNLE